MKLNTDTLIWAGEMAFRMKTALNLASPGSQWFDAEISTGHDHTVGLNGRLGLDGEANSPLVYIWCKSDTNEWCASYDGNPDYRADTAKGIVQELLEAMAQDARFVLAEVEGAP